MRSELEFSKKDISDTVTLTLTLALALTLTLTLGGSENLTSHYIFLLGMYVPPLGLG